LTGPSRAMPEDIAPAQFLGFDYEIRKKVRTGFSLVGKEKSRERIITLPHQRKDWQKCQPGILKQSLPARPGSLHWVNSQGAVIRNWKASAVSIMLTVLMTCEVFIQLNDIATEGYECGRPGEYDERLEMVVCEEHKRGLVDFNAARSPKGAAASTGRRLSGAA